MINKTLYLWLLIFGALLSFTLDPGVSEAGAENQEFVRTIESTSSQFKPLTEESSIISMQMLEPVSVEYTGPCTLDVDQDGIINALTDGVIIKRYLTGYRGVDLVEGALGPDARRTSPEEIEAFLNSQACQLMLDVDGDETIHRSTDGVLAARYMFGYSGDALIHDAIGQDAYRTTSDHVRAWLSMHHNPASHIRLTAPTLKAPLLPGVEASLEPGVIYTGTREVRLHLLEGPQGMDISTRSGRISWIPGSEHAGQDVEVRLSASDGDAYSTLAFTVRVAQPRPVLTSQTQTDDGRTKIIVTEDIGNLQGLEVIFPEQVSGAESLMTSRDYVTSVTETGVSIVNPADIDQEAIPDGITRLTNFFRIEPFKADDNNWIEIVFPELELNDGYYPHELILVVYCKSLDLYHPKWFSISHGLTIKNDQKISLQLGITGDVSFIGIRERNLTSLASVRTVDQLSTTEDTTFVYQSINLEDGQEVGVFCRKERIFVTLGLMERLNVDICSATMAVKDTDQRFKFRIEGLHDKDGNFAPNWYPIPSEHQITGWLLDSILKFEEFGLKYDKLDSAKYNLEILIEPLIDAIGDAPTAVDGSRVIRLHCSTGGKKISFEKIKSATVHEYFHHAQSRSGNIFGWGNDWKKRGWIAEGTAVWFEDEVYDDLNGYLIDDFIKTPFPRILDIGLTPEQDASDKLKNTYDRFMFFKLLQKTSFDDEADPKGCNFGETLLPDLFSGHSRGDHGAERLISVIDNSRHSCDFGTLFGEHNRNSIGTALEYYTYATQIKNNVTKLDYNEPYTPNDPKKPVEFESVDRFLEVDRELNLTAYPFVAMTTKLPPFSTRVYRLIDKGENNNEDALIIRGIRTIVHSGHPVHVTIRDSHGEFKSYFNTSESSTHTFVEQSEIDIHGWYVTLVNDNPNESVLIAFNIYSQEQAEILTVQNPQNNATLNNRVIDINGTVSDFDAQSVRINIPEARFEVVLPVANGSFSGMIPIAKGKNSINFSAMDVNGRQLGKTAIVNVTGQEHPDPTALNALVESQMALSLTWDQPRDMDIHVTDPYGRKIWYANRTVSDSLGYIYGRLDHDNIPGFGPGARNTPEVVTYFTDMNRNDDMQGCYEVRLHYYSSSGPTTNLTLDMLLNENQPGERRGHRVPVQLTTPRSWSDSIWIHCRNHGDKMICQRDQDYCGAQIMQHSIMSQDIYLPKKN